MTIKATNDFKVTGSRQVLNKISILADEAAKSYEADGFPVLADEARGIADAIYEALDAAGLYDKCREVTA